LCPAVRRSVGATKNALPVSQLLFGGGNCIAMYATIRQGDTAGFGTGTIGAGPANAVMSEAAAASIDSFRTSVASVVADS
jgi:hypothetical protein